MKIELIPVIEIGYHDQEIEKPNVYPYWEHQDVWQAYQTKSLKKAGFPDNLTPYLKASPFFRPQDITDANLKKVIEDHTYDLRTGAYERESASCLFGGFVLRVNNLDQFFPQCCGDLSDIAYWKKISNGIDSYYEGHPAPELTFQGNTVIFDFTVDEYDEHFQPTPPQIKLTVDLIQLKLAVNQASEELHRLGQRLIRMNQEMNLGIDRIDDLLIWENLNHQ